MLSMPGPSPEWIEQGYKAYLGLIKYKFLPCPAPFHSLLLSTELFTMKAHHLSLLVFLTSTIAAVSLAERSRDGKRNL